MSWDQVIKDIIRRLVLEAIDLDICAHLLRRKKEDKSFAFTEAGSVY